MNFIKAWIYIVVTCFYCLPVAVFAQKTFTVNGILYRYKTSDRITQAIITNLKTNVMMMSDELGGFSVTAAIGDTLLYNKSGYTPQKIAINGQGDIVVYMQPVISLAEVTIKGQTTQQQLNGVINTYRSKGLYFDGKPPLLLFSPFGGSPLTGLYELFSQDAANERHFIAFSKNEMESEEVDRRYTRGLVKQVTALPDTDVLRFMQQYTPSYEDMKGWNDYELISHIKKYLEYYKKHKDDAPPEKLN
jgi:hypothetical protein